ncbi:hypothetical protein IU443_29735 [Nocardia farcinica]|uniref:hypothetical protein n=1 Tax=Nocardia farcinica TaxID=37329 RepID=UPI0011158D32|nr:hypothetical protein [Nocardia farcinica]MBF6394113.1 hypothetical protein [Nocardia farcinica]MBF6538162.1 hypothetical protein [Nocardia farcinica]
MATELGFACGAAVADRDGVEVCDGAASFQELGECGGVTFVEFAEPFPCFAGRARLFESSYFVCE